MSEHQEYVHAETTTGFGGDLIFTPAKSSVLGKLQKAIIRILPPKNTMSF